MKGPFGALNHIHSEFVELQITASTCLKTESHYPGLRMGCSVFMGMG